MQEIDAIRAENVQLKEAITSRNQEIEQLKIAVETFEKDKTDRENSLKTKEEQQRKGEIETLLKQAIEDKKIPAKNEELQNKFRVMLMNDFENTKAILAAIPAIQNDTPEAKSTTGSQASDKIDLRELAESAYTNSPHN